jgi:hypothetical protein
LRITGGIVNARVIRASWVSAQQLLIEMVSAESDVAACTNGDCVDGVPLTIAEITVHVERTVPMLRKAKPPRPALGRWSLR